MKHLDILNLKDSSVKQQLMQTLHAELTSLPPENESVDSHWNALTNKVYRVAFEALGLCKIKLFCWEINIKVLLLADRMWRVVFWSNITGKPILLSNLSYGRWRRTGLTKSRKELQSYATVNNWRVFKETAKKSYDPIASNNAPVMNAEGSNLIKDANETAGR